MSQSPIRIHYHQANLVNDIAEVNLPDHFKIVAASKAMTVLVTPLSIESKGLAVIEKDGNHIVVKELMSGKGNHEFDYTVMAVRNGFEDYKLV